MKSLEDHTGSQGHRGLYKRQYAGPGATGALEALTEAYAVNRMMKSYLVTSTRRTQLPPSTRGELNPHLTVPATELVEKSG